jgi:hypothetical protein
MVHCSRRLYTLTVALLCLVAGPSLAQVSVVSTDASGVRFGLAVPTVSFDIGADYPFSTLNVLMAYDSSQLTFRPDESTVKVGLAPAIGFNDFIAALQLATGPNFLPNFGTPGLYGFSTSITPGQDPIIVSGPVTIAPAFLLDGHFSGPSFVYFEGDISGDDLEDMFNGTIAITAVPEPETWLLWAVGLGLLTRLSRHPHPAQLCASPPS